MIPDGSAVIWRGAMVSSAIRQLYNDVVWGDLDYLIIDLPARNWGYSTFLISVS